MSATSALIGILIAILIGAISPGPSLVVVSRIAIVESRSNGLAAAVGMGFGGAVFSTTAIVGLSALLLEVEWLSATLKLIGGLYLLYLNGLVWRGAAKPIPSETGAKPLSKSPFSSLSFGFAVQISNPKTAVVYASISAAMLPTSPPMWLLLSLPPFDFLIETVWYASVALACSFRRPREIYLNSKTLLDRTTAILLGMLGLRLVVEATGYK